MKNIKVYTLMILLTFAALFSGCSGDSPEGSSGGAQDRGGVYESKKYADLIKDVTDYGFEKDNSYTFDKEKDGYSCQITVETWLGKQSSNNIAVFHPANKNVPMPLENDTDCIIPFSATVKITTADARFATDIEILFRGGTERNQSMGYRCKANDREAIENTLQKFVDAWDKPAEYSWTNIWNTSSDFRYQKKALNDEMVFYGYYIIADYYSPTFPNGNPDIEPEKMMFLVDVAFNGESIINYAPSDQVVSFEVPVQVNG